MTRTRGRGAEDRPPRESAEGMPEGERQSGGASQAARRASAPDRLRKRILARALNILAARPRSETQLREQLLAKEWAEAGLVDECISRLKELGYVNDDLFAHSYASSRLRKRPISRSRVARELAGKKVARKTIDEALDTVFEEVGEDALIDRAIEKRLRTHGRPEDRNGSKRMFDHLARLGFEYDLIIRKLRALRAEVEENE